MIDETLVRQPAQPVRRFVRDLYAQVVEALSGRVHERATRCPNVNAAAVEPELPRPLVNQLSTVAACEGSPQAYDGEMPRALGERERVEGRAAPPPVPVAAIGRSTPIEPMSLPDIRLIDRPGRRDSPGATRPELKPLSIRRTVMVVDDDPLMLELLVRILQKENFEILTASSGPEALCKMSDRDATVDMLVTDYVMPEMSGRALADRMRERLPDIPVLYQTGFSDILFENRKELEGRTAFVEKPFTARGLREAARLMLFGTLNPTAH